MGNTQKQAGAAISRPAPYAMIRRADYAMIHRAVEPLKSPAHHSELWQAIARTDTDPTEILNRWGLRFAYAVMDALRTEEDAPADPKEDFPGKEVDGEYIGTKGEGITCNLLDVVEWMEKQGNDYYANRVRNFYHRLRKEIDEQEGGASE